MLLILLRHLRRHVGSDKAGGDGVNGNPAHPYFSGDSLCEPDDTRLRGGVTRLSGIAHDTNNGRNVDNPAASLAKHRTHHRARAIHRAGEVRLQNCIPILIFQTHEQRIAGDTGVVYENIDLRKPVQHRFDKCLYIPLFGDVRGGRDSRVSLAIQGVGDGGDGFGGT